MESRKIVLIKLFAGQQWRHRHTEQAYRPGLGEEGEGEMYRVTWKLTLPYIKQIANGNFPFLRKLKQGLYVNVEGWDGDADGRDVQEGGNICRPMADSC